MAETLSGNISEMSLLEILKLLNSGKMNGRLNVTNNVGRGEVYVKSGQIVHCIAGSRRGEDALNHMLAWIEGRFSFENGIETPEETIEKPTEQILLDGARMIKNWKDIKKIITSMDLIFALSPKSSTGAVNLQQDEWQILAYINGNRTIMEIVKASEKDEFEVAKIMYQLHSSGLIEISQNPSKKTSEVTDELFFKKIEEELINVMGPMAPIIINDAIYNLGETREAFPREKIAALIEKVSLEIKNENKKLLFSQIMINLLRNS